MEDSREIRTWIVTSGEFHEPGRILGVYPEDRATAAGHFAVVALKGGAKFGDFSEVPDGSAAVSANGTWYALDVFGYGPTSEADGS